MLGAELGKAGTPAIFGPNNLVFRFPAAYNQARELCQQPERLARIEEALRGVTGQPWKVRIEAEAASATPTGMPVAATNGTPAPRDRRSAKEEAEKVPLVKRALDVLGATIQRVDDGFGGSSPNGELTPGKEEV